ncbi:MAG TPA: hypothetical protein VGO57_11180 [Verrucomicrobiae bacterium]|jgi:hypothetical protein
MQAASVIVIKVTAGRKWLKRKATMGGIGRAATDFACATGTWWCVSVLGALFRRLPLRSATTLAAAQPKPPSLPRWWWFAIANESCVDGLAGNRYDSTMPETLTNGTVGGFAH